MECDMREARQWRDVHEKGGKNAWKGPRCQSRNRTIEMRAVRRRTRHAHHTWCSTPFCLASLRNTPSASGERQMLPKQTNRTDRFSLPFTIMSAASMACGPPFALGSIASRTISQEKKVLGCTDGAAVAVQKAKKEKQNIPPPGIEPGSSG